VLLSELPPTRELKLQAIRLGGLGITGLSIKDKSPLKPTINIELANGYHGYIPPPDQHKLGGYTTWRARSSCLEEDAEPKIAACVLGLLEQVANERKNELPVRAK
jgi:neutral ceramidase